MSFEKDVVVTALKKLFSGKSFSICEVDTIGEILGANPRQHRNYPLLRALHCINYAEMTDEVRQALPAKVMECLRPDGLNFEAMAMALTREGRDLPPIEDAPIARVAELPWRSR